MKLIHNTLDFGQRVLYEHTEFGGITVELSNGRRLDLLERGDLGGKYLEVLSSNDILTLHPRAANVVWIRADSENRRRTARALYEALESVTESTAFASLDSLENIHKAVEAYREETK